MKTFPRSYIWCERKRIAYFGSPWEHASALYCGDTLVRICENERDIYKGATPLWCPENERIIPSGPTNPMELLGDAANV